MRGIKWTLPLLGYACAACGDQPVAGLADSAGAESASADSAPIDTAATDTAALDRETGDSGAGQDSAAPAAVATCMVGMVPVPPEAPLYCIDAYEVSLGTLSLAGQSPEVALTFHMAVEACEAAAVVDESGAVRGYKRLASDAEWEDAADGTPGEGGWAFPYGDLPVEGACILPDAGNTPVYDELQPTGSAPACVSQFGAYDQIGNAWEWVDPGQSVDTAAWFAAASAAGHDLRVGDDDRLYSGDVDLSWMNYEGVIVTGFVPYAAEDGALTLEASAIELPNDAYLSGYLEASDQAELEERYLPVALVDQGDMQLALYLESVREGETFTSKRGCAYYTGTAIACTNQSVSHEHPPGFAGTIGYRCTSDPIPPAE